MMWMLRYYRYFALEEYEAESKEEVLSVACYGEEDGQFSVHEILSPDGEVFMDKEQFRKYWFSQEES